MTFNFTGKAALVVFFVVVGVGVVFYQHPDVLSWLLTVLGMAR